MAGGGAVVAVILSVVLSAATFPGRAGAWGPDGHAGTCLVAESLMEPSTLKAVRSLLPDSANGSLASLCLWADEIKKNPAYEWSTPLHYIDTPDNACSYNYDRDCYDEHGTKGMCAAGAILNFTSQLTKYHPQGQTSRPLLRNAHEPEYNFTESLLFLSHIVGDIHQPMHIGFISDVGGNLIFVNWYTLLGVRLHHVWDVDMPIRGKKLFYDNSLNTWMNKILQNITNNWDEHAQSWGKCSNGETACPNTYASEGIKIACQWGYKDAPAGANLGDEYFLTRLPVLESRIAQGGVRLAAILNRLFGANSNSKRLASL